MHGLFLQDYVHKMLEIQRSLIGQFEVIKPGRVSSVFQGSSSRMVTLHGQELLYDQYFLFSFEQYC